MAQVQTSELHVLVKDAKGAVVSGATVTAAEPSKGISRTATTNAEGSAILLSLPPGLYSVTVEVARLRQDGNQLVRLHHWRRSAELPVQLSVAAATETVTVSSEAELVETQQTASGTTIDQTRIENLPINGRNYVNFALTNSQLSRDTTPSIGAAPTSGLNIGGQRGRSNLINIDGTNAVDNSVNGIRSTVSQDAVQEFQILTNGYAAEYGQAAAGVINIISKSGTNDFHGSAFGYLRNRYIQATNPFSNVESAGLHSRTIRHRHGRPHQEGPHLLVLLLRRHRPPRDRLLQHRHRQFRIQLHRRHHALSSPHSWHSIAGQHGRRSCNTGTGTNVPSSRLTVNQANTIGYAFLVGSSGPVAITGRNPLTQALGLGPGYFFAPTPPPSSFLCPQSFVPMESLVGNFPVHELSDIYSLRLDHKITNNQQLMLRGSVSPDIQDGIEVNAQGPQVFGQNCAVAHLDEQLPRLEHHRRAHLDHRQQQGQRIPLPVRAPQRELFVLQRRRRKRCRRQHARRRLLRPRTFLLRAARRAALGTPRQLLHHQGHAQHQVRR